MLTSNAHFPCSHPLLTSHAHLSCGAVQLDDFKDDVTNRLAPGVSQLRARNEENQAQVGQVRALLARQRASDVTQGAAIASLLLALRNWKRDSPEVGVGGGGKRGWGGGGGEASVCRGSVSV